MTQRIFLQILLRITGIVAAGVLAFAIAPHQSGVVARIAWYTSILALAGTIASAGTSIGTRTTDRAAQLREELVWGARHVALYLGVAGAIFQTILLTMRSVYFAIDLIHGFPWQGARDFGFGPAGLWTIGVLCAACLIELVCSRDARLATLQFWLLVLLTIWACQLSPAFQPTQTGGYVRTDATLIMVECLACLLLMSVLLIGWLLDARYFGPDSASKAKDATDRIAAPLPPGFGASSAVLALALNIAVLFQILVPTGQSTFSFRLSGFRAGCAAAIAGLGCFYLLRRSWNSHLAESGLGLFALAVCGLATLAIPARESPLADEYPMLFNALIIGYSFAAALFAHCTSQWGEGGLGCHSLRARLVPHLKRFAFLSGATALLSGVMMCFWPGMPGISAMDHSLGRVLAGVSGFLFLLLVSLRSGRLMARASFHILTLAAATSMVAFLLVRAMPFLSERPNG